MTKTIDFAECSIAHEPIDQRLKDWARWVKPRASSWVHPMWRKNVTSNVHSGNESALPLNTLDAQAVEKAVSALPEKHREAIRWNYVTGGCPRRAARGLGVSGEGLYLLIVSGRQMLINRRV